MADETRAGAFSGVLAGILVVVLCVMAFMALEPAQAPRTQMVDLGMSDVELPNPPDILPDAS
jgi:Na+/proline symporter